MTTRISANLSLYLPELLPTLGEFLREKDAAKGRALLLQLITAFSPEQKAQLFEETRQGYLPDPLRQLHYLIKDYGELNGAMDTNDFLTRFETILEDTTTIDGQPVKLPDPAVRMQRISQALADGRISEKELEMYTQLKSVENTTDPAMGGVGPDGLPVPTEQGLTSAERFLDAAAQSSDGNEDIQQIKDLATQAVDAEATEDAQDVALYSAAAGETVRQDFETFRDTGWDPTGEWSGGPAGGTSYEDSGNGLSSGSAPSRSYSPDGSSSPPQVYTSRSPSYTAPNPGNNSSPSQVYSSRDASSSGYVGGTENHYQPSGIGSPGGAGNGIDVGDVTSIDLSPTEQQLYDKLKAEDPQAAERFFLQQKLAKISEMAAMLSNIAKMRHDAAMAIIGNMR